MIGSGLKKLAVENGMTVARGVAYGNLHGYAATLSEGNGYKQIVLTTCFGDPEKLQTLQTQINQQNISREFRVANLSFAPNGVSVVFRDNPGTMKKIQAFIDWFFPLLDQAGASGWDICTECGNQITGGCWKLIDGIAFHLHESCADRVVRGLNEEEQQRKDEDTGSYLSGAVGALIGALIGAIVWAIVLNFGYVASIVGLLIGFLAEKGYIAGRMPPIVVDGIQDVEAYINPIPSGLVLTGIVVSVSVTALMLRLTIRLYKRYHTLDLDEISIRLRKEGL